MPHQATALRPQRSNSRTEVRDRILSALPSLAYQIATLHENPVSSKHERELRELLEKIIGALQVHQPIELLRDAVRQLAAASSAAEIQVKTLEAVIPNRRALAETKVNLQVLSASEVDTHFEVLDRARKVASQGGILRRYATEGVVLSAFLTLINQRRVVSPSIRMSTRVLPEVNTATETVIRMRAENISTARKQLDTEAKQHAQVLNLPTVRSLHRDRDRKEILGNFHNASTSLERVVALSRLRGDHDSEALNFQLKVLLDRKADSGVREVACCLLELVGAATPPKEGDEFARHLLIRVTQMLLCRKTESAELLMMLRVIASFGEAQISIVVT